MTVALVMIVKDEASVIGRALDSAETVVDEAVVVDTGSVDATLDILRSYETLPITVHERPWVGFAHNVNEALALAGETADWLLRLDADMTVDAHPDLKAWLDVDPDPETDAWMVEIHDHGLHYRLPMLTRGGLEWTYRGATHEWLDMEGRKRRSLLGLTLHHFHDGGNQEGKLERHLELLAPGMEDGDPRDTFYTAECFRFLGRTGDAIEVYNKRASMDGFEEERWYAAYQAASLAADVEALVGVWRERPWRHEPLSAAARIVAAQPNDDLLFLEGSTA